MTPNNKQNEIIEFIARIECDLKKKKIIRGQQKAISNGKKWGGSKKGWRWKVTDEQINSVKRMRSEKIPISRISRIVKLSRPTIYKILDT